MFALSTHSGLARRLAMLRGRAPRMLALLAVFALVLAAFAPASDAFPRKEDRKKKPSKSAAESKEKSADGFKPWSEVTKDAEKIEGFFTIYKKPDKIYFEVRKEQLDMDFLGVFSFARGIGTNFMLGGLPLNDRMLAFQRIDNDVLLLDKNMLFTAPAGSPIERARDLSHGHSVLASLDILSEDKESKSVLVDMTGVIVSDVSDLSTWASRGLNNQPVRFDAKRSAFTQIKNFPKNTEIEALLTYSPSKTQIGALYSSGDASLYTVPDPRYVPITVHYSFVELPEVPMQPRLADERVGYFLTVKKDFSLDENEEFWVRNVNRWRLEKKDPSAEVSEPVKPIVFYIDRTVPEQYHDWVKQGVEKWQRAYEEAGFRNAIIAKVAPTEEEDPDWDAEDVRYSTIRWIASGGASFNAIGPSRVDPRTGEILDADILVEAAAMQGYRTSWRKYAGPADMAADILPELPADLPLPADRLCMSQSSAALDGGFMRAALLLSGALPPGSPVPDEYMEPFVVRLIMHEVGHTLGLRHNFRSSTATPFDKLHDRTWTSDRGLMGSVMDYVTPNISSDRSLQGEYFITTTGTYDRFAIRYGYTPSGVDDVARDHAFAQTIAAESTKPGHEYSTDHDASAVNALDPRTSRWDLSDDPLRWAEERSAYIEDLWRNGRLEERILGEDGEYPILSRAMNTLLVLYGRTCVYATKYFGGQHHVADHRGQPGAQTPLQPVPAAKQRQAMQFLSGSVFSPDAFDVSPGLLNRLAPDRWTHWGQPQTFSPGYRIDYDLTGRALAMQTFILNRMLNPGLLNRLHEAENRSDDAYTLAEYLSGLTGAIWGEVDGAMGPGMRRLEDPTPRRDLQRRYLDMLSTMVVEPFPGTPDDARAIARLELTRIDARARRALAIGSLGDYTRAHLLETRARIGRALEAERLTNG